MTPGSHITVDLGSGPVRVEVHSPVDASGWGHGQLVGDPNSHVAWRAEDVRSAEPTSICATCNGTHLMMLRDRKVMCTSCPVPCERCAGHGGTGAYCATTPCKCDCHASCIAEPAPRSDGAVVWEGPARDEARIAELERDLAALEDTIAYAKQCLAVGEDWRAAAEGRALGWQRRALLAEIDTKEARVRQWAVTRDAAYAIGHRDGLSVGAHRDALIADVLQAIADYHDAPEGSDAEEDADQRGIEANVRWIRAGRPGLAREGS